MANQLSGELCSEILDAVQTFVEASATDETMVSIITVNMISL